MMMMMIVEFATLTRDATTGTVRYHVFTKAELETLLKDADGVLKEARKKAEAEAGGTSDI
jgi:hypothetical protein